jgi:hypothetical protein
MSFDLLEWLAKQPPSVGTFLGTLVGSSLGLLALLIGALVNAHLNRRRDDRLRNEEAASIRSALRGELVGVRDAFTNLASEVEKTADPREFPQFLVPDLTSLVRVMPLLLSKFGLLPPDTVRQVIDAYVTIEHFKPTLMLLGGKPHTNELHIALPQDKGARVAAMARSVAKRIDGAIATLTPITHRSSGAA